MISPDLELEDVTEEVWIQARTDSLVLEEAIDRGLLDANEAAELSLIVAGPTRGERERISRTDHTFDGSDEGMPCEVCGDSWCTHTERG